jgi:hypothetical protein
MWMRTAIVLGMITTVALAAPEEPATSEARIKQLREQRVAVLKQVYETVLALHKDGTQGFGIQEVHKAKTQLLRARLDLATARQERIKIHEELVATAKTWLDSVTAIRNIGGAGGSGIDVLKAQAYYLESQVALEQAKAGN